MKILLFHLVHELFKMSVPPGLNRSPPHFFTILACIELDKIGGTFQGGSFMVKIFEFILVFCGFLLYLQFLEQDSQLVHMSYYMTWLSIIVISHPPDKHIPLCACLGYFCLSTSTILVVSKCQSFLYLANRNVHLMLTSI